MDDIQSMLGSTLLDAYNEEELIQAELNDIREINRREMLKRKPAPPPTPPVLLLVFLSPAISSWRTLQREEVTLTKISSVSWTMVLNCFCFMACPATVKEELWRERRSDDLEPEV